MIIALVVVAVIAFGLMVAIGLVRQEDCEE